MPEEWARKNLRDQSSKQRISYQHVSDNFEDERCNGDEAVKRSIELSEQKYCSVGATLSYPVRITSTFEVKPTEEAEPD